MATGPFQYDSATREFKRRDSARPWASDKDAEADAEAAAAMVAALEEPQPDPSDDDVPLGAVVNPAPIRRRRRRSYAAAEEPVPKKTKLWRAVMWGLILVLLIGWLVMIAILTSRSGAGANGDREFEFDRGDAVETLLP